MPATRSGSGSSRNGTLLFIEAETTGEVGSDLDQEIEQIIESIRFDRSRPTTAEYSTQAAAICGDAISRFRAEGAGPSAAWIESAARFSEEALAELRALRPPKPDRARIKDVYSLIEQQTDVFHRMAAAASAGDTARADDLHLKRVDLSHQIYEHGRRYGLHLCPIYIPNA